MARKYEIYQELRFEDTGAIKGYNRLTTQRNEQAAIDFVEDIENIRKYGDMIIQVKANGHIGTYSNRKWSWE